MLPGPQEALKVDTIERITVRLFAEGGRLEQGGYRYGDVPARARGFIEGLHELEVYDEASRALSLRVYELSESPAARQFRQSHWRNEVMAALRMAHTQHRCLPHLEDAALFDQEDFGFVLLEDTGFTLKQGHPLYDRFIDEPGFAFHRFMALLEALAMLHDERLMHRFIMPRTTRALKQEDAFPILDGFQLSAFTRTWLRGAMGGEQGSSLDEKIEGIEVCFVAPERRGARGRRDRGESPASDVFAIGMIALDWLALPHAAWAVPIGGEEGGYDEVAHQTLVSHLLEKAREKLPRELVDVLADMVAFYPSNRPASARDAHDRLLKRRDTILHALEPPPEQEHPYEVRFLDASCARLFSGRFVQAPPNQRRAIPHYKKFIERDLHGGTLVYSSEGFSPYSPSDPVAEMDRAKLVLLGKECVYFCVYLQHDRGQDPDTRLLLIKYVSWGDESVALRQSERQRTMPAKLSVEFYVPGGRNAPTPARAPRWDAFFGELARAPDEHRGASSLVLASRWRLGVAEALLEASIFPVRVQDTHTSNSAITLRADPDREHPHEGYAKLLHEALDTRVEMGDFFERKQVESLEHGRELECMVWGRGGEESRAVKLEFVRALDPHTVRLKLREDTPIPWKQGYLAPILKGERAMIARQRQALSELVTKHGHLHAQLLNPMVLEIPPVRPLQHDEGLDEDTIALIERLVTTRPLFVVQGPPGTGKTFTSSAAIATYLEHDPHARVLVTAQSHDALDNLLEGVAARLDLETFRLLRCASAHTRDKVGEVASRFLENQVLKDLVDGILASPLPEDASQAGEEVARSWRRLLEGDGATSSSTGLELAIRLKESASVVFCTTGSATANNLGVFQPSSLFDWVVIEEAARGWLTEMLIPMNHGVAWLLVGDHKQLPAFNAKTYHRLFGEDVEHRISEEATSVPVHESQRAWLGYFEHLMGYRSEGTQHSRAQLTTQRRMHPEIAALVSEAFYDNTVTSHPLTAREREHGYTSGWLADRHLVWLDTSCFGDRARESGLRNDLEVHVIRWLLSQHLTHPQEERDGIGRRVILSPYIKQQERLRQKLLSEPVEVHTVDSFQGRQAEEVIISMTRSNTETHSSKSLGFMADPSRLNVLFSRARRLLVLVGDFEHYKHHAECDSSGALGRLLEHIEHVGARLSLDALGFSTPGGR